MLIVWLLAISAAMSPLAFLCLRKRRRKAVAEKHAHPFLAENIIRTYCATLLRVYAERSRAELLEIFYDTSLGELEHAVAEWESSSAASPR
jgi:hypothetical protein